MADTPAIYILARKTHFVKDFGEKATRHFAHRNFTSR
jgi:hypothetical protein